MTNTSSLDTHRRNIKILYIILGLVILFMAAVALYNASHQEQLKSRLADRTCFKYCKLSGQVPEAEPIAGGLLGYSSTGVVENGLVAIGCGTNVTEVKYSIFSFFGFDVIRTSEAKDVPEPIDASSYNRVC